MPFNLGTYVCLLVRNSHITQLLPWNILTLKYLIFTGALYFGFPLGFLSWNLRYHFCLFLKVLEHSTFSQSIPSHQHWLNWWFLESWFWYIDGFGNWLVSFQVWDYRVYQGWFGWGSVEGLFQGQALRRSGKAR